MPQFALNTTPTRRDVELGFKIMGKRRKVHPFNDLDNFAKGYVEAMFFTNCDTGDEREDSANRLGVKRLTRASVAAIARDCKAFLSHVMPDGCRVTQWLARVADDYSEEQAGRDFWFTRQGHGVGFWDREELRRDLWTATAAEIAADKTLGGWVLADDTEERQFMGVLGDEITAAAESFGEVYPEIYRGWIYYR